MKKYVMLMIMIFALVLFGCASKEDSNTTSEDTNSKEQEETKAIEVIQEEKNVTEDSGSESEKSEPQDSKVDEKETILILPVTVNSTGKLLIQTVSKSKTYPHNSYIITSSNGESVVVDPTQMPAKSIVDINPVAIMNTHSHPDHTDAAFSKEYDVPKLVYEKGELQTSDFHIYSIISSHSNDTILETNKNIIVVFEVDGLRIAHMGDIGQTSLTDEQLSELGEIDIAFMQFENSYSGMTLDNAKGFTMIEQLNPKIIIPTHYTEKSLPVLEEKYGIITEVDNILEISIEDLPETSLNVYRILNNHKYN